MSIFDIDWNDDGKLDFMDTAIDCMIIDELDKEDEDEDEDDSF